MNLDSDTKECLTCKKLLPLDLFCLEQYKPRVVYARFCANCREARKAKGRKRASIKYEFKARLKKYSITEDQYIHQVKAQGNLCAICGLPEQIKGRGGCVKPLAIDHCHETGKFRGLLCQKCNTGIGQLNDNIDILASAISYLQQ